MVDEMDLVGQLKEAAPPRPEAYQRARASLRAAMAESGPARGPEMTTLVPGAGPVRSKGYSRAHSRRRAVGTRGTIGIGAGIGVAAAAVAIALVATSAPRSASPGGTAPQASAGSSSAPAARSPLVSLAAYIEATAGGPLPGDATLVITHKSSGEVVWELYTDGGALYPGDDKATIMQAIAQHANLADGMLASEVKAALFAAKGDPTAARMQMATVSPGDKTLSLPLAAQKAIWEKNLPQEEQLYKEKGVKHRPTPPTAKSVQMEIDNRVWNNSVDALSAGGGNPQVRAGVLRLLSTISAVSVVDSTTGGVPTLTITAGPEVLGGSGEQVLTVNAKTGMPIESVMKDAPGTSVYTYQVKRVTLAEVKAGKF